MSPFAILSLALGIGFTSGWLVSHADPITAATIAAIAAISFVAITIIVQGPKAPLSRLTAAYIASSAVVCLAVAATGLRPVRPGIRASVSVYFAGTCETLIPVKDGRDAGLFFDGHSYAYIRHEDITAISPRPGCGDAPA